MSLFCRLSGKHYWCTPHRSEDDRLVQVCYECGAERPARELHKEALLESKSASITTLIPNSKRRAAVPRPIIQQPVPVADTSRERVAVAQGSRRLVIVK